MNIFAMSACCMKFMQTCCETYGKPHTLPYVEENERHHKLYQEIQCIDSSITEYTTHFVVLFKVK